MMKPVLKGKTALVTGAAKRVGREIALALASEGAGVVIHCNRSRQEAEELGSLIGKSGGASWIVQADFEKPAEYTTLIDRSIDAAGKLDILINSASIFPVNTLKDLEYEDITRNVHINAWVPFALSRAFARKAGHGDIINLLDTRIIGHDFNHAAYILSKHMLSVLTEMTAIEYAPNIRVNAVAPGLILPPPGKDGTFLEQVKDMLPLKRYGSPENVADAVLFLLKNDFITGQTVFVDGGRHLREKSGG